MKRIFNSCLFLIFLFSVGKVNSQTINFSLAVNPQCYNASNNYTANAGLFIQVPGATNYSWAVQAPTGTCVPTFSLGQHGALNSTNTGSQIALTFPCCGVFTITCFAFNLTVTPGTPILVTNGQNNYTVFCQTSGSVIVTPSVVCIGQQVTFSGTGGAVNNSYTWTSGFVGQNQPLTPSVNVCQTYTATTPDGCTISPVPACASVQAVSMTVSPATQTICAGSPICLTATANAISNSSVTLGTATTAIIWKQPGGLTVPGCTTTAVAGTYTAEVSHTGAAGVCTYTMPAVVVTSTNVSISASASAPSVCPGATVQLTAASVQTAAASYTWTRPGPFTVTGNPVTFNPFLLTTYTVDVDYFGCPGQTVITVGMLTLQPTLTPSSFSICPGTSFSLSASGGSLYTFRYLNPGAFPFPTSTVIGTSNSTVNVRVHTPTVTPNAFPALYSVSSTSNGCSGSTTITVFTRTLYPTLSNSSQSVCPGTEFTLCAGMVGAGATYTFLTPYLPGTIATADPTVNCAVHTPPLTNTFPTTYSLVADSAGCRGTAEVTVHLLPLTPTLIPSSFSICAGTAMNFTATGGAGTSYTFAGPASPGPTVAISTGTANIITHTVTTSPPLAHTYTVYADSAGCIGSNTVMIGELNLGPLINITASSPSICLGTSVGFTAAAVTGPGNFNYVFVAPGPTTLAPTSINTATDIPSALPGTYTVYADSSSCAGSNTITIFEKVLNPIILANNTLVCKNQTVTLSATNVGTGPGVVYSFGIINPVIQPLTTASSLSFATHSPSVQTVYSVLVDSVGCKGNPLSPPTVTVYMRPDLVLNPTSTSPSVCPGTAATLNVTGPPGNTAPISYTWAQTAGNGSLYPVPAPSATAIAYPVTNSTYSIAALDSLGCVGSTVISVGIDPLISFPVALSSSGSTICAGTSVTLTTSYTINTTGPISFTWSPITGTLSSVNNVSLAVSPSVTTNYSVIATNQYGCISGGTITVPVGQYPSLVAPASSTAVCAGFTSTLTAFGANSYTWTGSTFTNAIPQQSISVSPGSYTVVGSNGGTCTSTLTAIIGSLSPLTINVSQSSGTTCIESNTPKFSKPVKLIASGAATYVWFPYNPNNMTYSLGPTTDVRPPTSTCYTVIGSTSICSGTQQVCVTVIPQFSMNVIPPLPAMCLGDSLKLSIVNIGTLAVGPVSKFTYSWTEAANAPPISISNNLTPTVMVFPQNTTTYSVEVRDSRQCISLPRLVTVTVFPKPITAIAIPTINSVATNTVCYVGLNPGAQDVTINLIAANGNTGLQFGVVPTYTWLQPYKKEYNSILTPSNSAGITVNAPVKLPSVVVYTVISGYNGILGCKRVDTVSIRVVDCRPVRDVKFTTIEDNDTICARNCITFANLTDTMAGGPQKLAWQFPGGSPATSTLNIPTVCYNLPGKYNVILGVANPYPVSTGGSSLTIGQLSYIKVVDVPNVTIIPPGQSRSDTTVRFGQSVALKGTGALTYEWSPRYNITSLTNPNVTVNPFKTTQYILTGYNSKRCASSDTINVIIIDNCGEMYVPNAFTPNNDGANDVLYVRGICLESLTFMIFNRWGEKVFETNDQSNGWDGTYKGVDMNTGIFVYRLEGKTFDGKGFSLKGNVTLLR